MILFGEKALRNAVREYVAHYHGQRNHQGLTNELIETGDRIGQANGELARRDRLGGMLKYYHRQAA